MNKFLQTRSWRVTLFACLLATSLPWGLVPEGRAGEGEITEVMRDSSGDYGIEWASVSGKIYRVQSASNLSDLVLPWKDITGKRIARGPKERVIDPDAQTNPVQFYRILEEETSKAETTPTFGEGGVAITREFILRFDQALDNSVVIDGSVIFAEFGGERLDARIHIADDRRTLSLFFGDLLPPGARVRVTIEGDRLLGEDGFLIDVDGDQRVGGRLEVDFDTLTLTLIPGTRVVGRVFASELTTGSDTNVSVNVPLEGAKITVDGMEDTLFTYTDALGDFVLEPAPAGRFFVHIDGRTADKGVPTGAYYPFVGKAWESVVGEEASVGEIYLPLVAPETLTTVSASQETMIMLPPDVQTKYPELADTMLMVPPNSLYANDGTRGGQVGIAPVAPDRLPGTLPPELDFPIVITVQTDGPTNFDEPVPICFPNLDGLAPGETSALFSFNHDSGRFEIAGSMTVTPDGKLLCTDPGFGVLAPGWHGPDDGTEGSGGDIDGPEETGKDQDGDTYEDDEDNCPTRANRSQSDIDQDGIGDVCDDDRDGDGVPNDIDKCPDHPDPNQEDADGDGTGDACDDDSDFDKDGVVDSIDNCPKDKNPGQEDADEDDVGDVCDDCNGTEGYQVSGGPDLCLEDMLQLSASATGGTGETKEWESANPAVATVDNNGSVTAVGPGPVTIKVKDERGCSGSIDLKVHKVAFVGEPASLAEDATSYDAKAQLTPDSFDQDKLDWAIELEGDGDPATIDASGQVTLPEMNIGAYNITATSQDAPGCTDTFKLSPSDCDDVVGSVTFGGYTLSLVSDAKSTGRDGEYCQYSVNDASFSLKLPHTTLEVEAPKLEGVKLSFKRKSDGTAFKDVTIEWTGRKEFTIDDFKAVISGVNLTIDSSGNMSGGFDVTVSLEKDIVFEDVFYIRKGVTGKITINFNSAPEGSAGNVSWDFGGVQNIKAEVEKSGVILLTVTGKLTAMGVFEGTLAAGGVAYDSNSFTIEVPVGALSVNFKYDFKTGKFEVTGGMGFVDIKRVTGLAPDDRLRLELMYDGKKWTAKASFGAATVFGMTISEATFTVVFTKQFDLTSYSGSFTAKHPDFEEPFKNVQFALMNGMVSKFAVQSVPTIKWRSFTVNIANTVYSKKDGLKFDIALTVTASASFKIEKFQIDPMGNVSLEKISGTVNQAPVTVSFTANFPPGGTAFSGSFSGKVTGGISIAGTVNVGIQGGNPAFTYMRLLLTVGTNIPIGMSGLKVTSISGEFGYNFNSNEGPGGSPQLDTHTFGLGFGLGDVAGLMELTGFARLVLGEATSISLIGQVQVTQSTPYFKGTMAIEYTLGSGTVNGSLSSTLKIPADGSVVSMNQAVIAYTVGNGKWTAAGAMNGKLFNNPDLSVMGTVNLNGPLSAPLDGMSGTLSGTISGSVMEKETYPEGFNPSTCQTAQDTDTLGFGITGNFNLVMTGTINVGLKSSGVTGSFGVGVTATGLVQVKLYCLYCGSDCVSNYNVSATGMLTATQSGNNLNLKGNLNVTGPGFGQDMSFDVDV